MEELVTGPFAEVLRRNRGRLNQAYRESEASSPGVNPELFKLLVGTVAEPVISGLSSEAAETVDETLLALMQALLFVAGRDLFSATEIHGFAPLTELLKASPHLLRQSPPRLINSLFNAWLNLRRTNPGSVEKWLALTDCFWKLSQSSDEALKSGPIAAWLSGAAQYRKAALERALELRPEFVHSILALEGSEPLDAIISRLHKDPWLSPRKASVPQSEAPQRVRLIRRIGAFTGFGGLFHEPPLVFLSADGELVVFDGDRCWLMHADIYGSAFVRYSQLPMLAEKEQGRFKVAPDGTISAKGIRQKFPQLESASSSASTQTTCAVTVPFSHSVFILGLVPEE